ncbi:uncharacterized protein [Elaeis guineensis]|uniref:Uncharacterized protein LOC105041244 n=1 Tax=Elaeis guineensis var. tenera TaxID=51953 RepID=A0A6I9QWE3_ELAGV|nr:uncharacterized protein LOC105041244 [Elaeis guineensis]
MSLAITEKRQPQHQRPGGCVGIFFQLLDWNRRLAKKKLFSKRLLPPVRTAKRVSKKVGGGGDDKMPMAKLLLIADENRGGFPNAKESDDLGDEMRAPGLVARLMGLESMPVVTREKPRKSLDSESEKSREKGGSDFPRLDQDLCLENGGLGKLESRPQKLQKTGGFLERQPANAAWAGSDVLLFSKNVLSSRSRKQHRKLASPVKSPRLLSGTHRARLVQAATRILEPGLQSRNRDKCALTYMSSSQANAAEGSAAFASSKRSQELLSGSLVGSCRSCGSLVEVSELRLGAKEPIENEHGSSALELSNASSSHDSCLEGKTKLSFMESKQSQTSLAVQAKVNVQSKLHDFTERKKHVQNDQDPCKPQQDLAPRTIPKKKILRQNQPTPVRDKVAPGFKECGRRQGRRDLNESNEPKDFVALNRNMNNCSRMRSTSKEPERHRMETGRNGWERNIPRKRTINSSHFENVGAVNSTFEKPRIVGSHLINRKTTMPSSSRAINRNCVKSELQKDGGHSFSGRNNDIVSFVFNSPMKHATRPCSYREVVEKSGGQGEISHDSSRPKNFVLNPKSGNSMPQRRTALSGDELSNLLEQKIRELTSLDQDELGKRDARSTASILEDLISALTGGAPITEENDGNCFGGSSTMDDIRSHCIDLPNFPISQSQMCNNSKDFQEDAKASISASYLASNNDQPSPISILEASFSNDSCSFGSHNCSLGGKLHFGLTESCNTAVSFDLDNDLLDSATSIDVVRSDIGMMPHFSDRSSAKVSEVKLPESKLSNAGETILNAGLLFENICVYNSDGTVEFSVKSFLLGLLETLVHAFVIGPKSCSDYTDAEERNWLRVFIFDCIIECLDLKYSQFCKSGYKTWLKLPLFLSRDRLTREVQEEIKGWMALAGRFLDDMIEKEMSHSTGKWTDCEIEAFETGTEVETDILQTLVDEMVIDLC